MDDRSLFRFGPDYAPAGFAPVLDWSEHPGGLLGAVEMCNNNGTCRKFDADVMCPSFRATRDEAHLTRGRANTLRLALSGQLGPNAMASDEIAEAMSLCVSCKACRRECPTGVDMARMKIEVLHAQRTAHGLDAREWLIASLPRWAPFAAMAPGLFNAREWVPGGRWLLERLLGLSASRPLPRFRADAFHDWELPEPRGRDGEIILLPDLFNRYFEPGNLRAAVRVLRAAGATPTVARPPRGMRPLDTGRSWLAAGMVAEARAELSRTLSVLSRFDAPIIGIEPSCLLTLRDEAGALLPGDATRAIAARALLLSEWLVREHVRLPLKPLSGVARVHGHCHQKSFGAFADALSALRAIPGLEIQPIASSCCGMAGAFGYVAANQDASRAMAGLSLLPALSGAPTALIVADGTSCRHQIADLAGRPVLHSVRVLEMALR
jgi:Fe-S oxidoreductase